MTTTLTDRYREALVRGHLAARQGEPALALTFYEEAADCAPDRALPLSAQGAMLLRLGRPADAAVAFEAALDRSPADPGALAGRGEALSRIGRVADAAGVLDRLVGVLVAADRPVEALEVARRSLELAESTGRRRELTQLVEAVRGGAAAEDGRDAVTRATALLEGRATPAAGAVAGTAPSASGAIAPARPEETGRPATVAPTITAISEAASTGTPKAPEAPAEKKPRRNRRSMRWILVNDEPEPGSLVAGGAESASPAPAPAAPAAPTAPAPAAPAAPAGSAAPAAPAEPAASASTVPPPAPAAAAAPRTAVPDEELTAPELLVAADAALEAGDLGRARILLIDLARADAAAGRRDAALDACYRGLAVAPDDLTLHLLLVQLYLERGWRELAGEKVELLERLTELDGDEVALGLVRSARKVVAGRRKSG